MRPRRSDPPNPHRSAPPSAGNGAAEGLAEFDDSAEPEHAAHPWGAGMPRVQRSAFGAFLEGWTGDDSASAGERVARTVFLGCGSVVLLSLPAGVALRLVGLSSALVGFVGAVALVLSLIAGVGLLFVSDARPRSWVRSLALIVLVLSPALTILFVLSTAAVALIRSGL